MDEEALEAAIAREEASLAALGGGGSGGGSGEPCAWIAAAAWCLSVSRAEPESRGLTLLCPPPPSSTGEGGAPAAAAGSPPGTALPGPATPRSTPPSESELQASSVSGAAGCWLR